MCVVFLFLLLITCVCVLLQEAVQCVSELDLGSQLHVFVRVGVESTLERSQITRDHMGQLLFLLVQQGILPKPQFYKGSVPQLLQRTLFVVCVQLHVFVNNFWINGGFTKANIKYSNV